MFNIPVAAAVIVATIKIATTTNDLGNRSKIRMQSTNRIGFNFFSIEFSAQSDVIK
jgi:hypothetical protein